MTQIDEITETNAKNSINNNTQINLSEDTDFESEALLVKMAVFKKYPNFGDDGWPLD